VTPTWPIIGRVDEIASILADLGRGVGALVVGEAGVGKTMLAREVRRRLDADGWRTELVLCGARMGSSLPTLAHAVTVEGASEMRPVDRSSRLPDSPKATVLLVDDVHLLDDESAESLWRVVGGGEAMVVATARSGTRLPDRVARLWADGACAHLSLGPLAEGDIRALLEIVLGGDVEDRLPRLLVRRAAGNALLLRELVRSGVDSGTFERSHKVWRLAGELPIGAGATDLIRRSLSGLDGDELRAVQLLAIGEPLRFKIAETLIGHGLMEALEEKRVLALDETTDGPVLTLGHPLYGEVLRADIAPLRMRRLQKELIEAIKCDEPPNPHDILRSVMWRIESGDLPDPPDLLAAAHLARSFNAGTAERLARAALAARVSVDGVMLLAEILIMQGRVGEVDGLLDGIEAGALSEEQRQSVTYARALCQTRLGEVRQVTAMFIGEATETKSQPLQAAYAQALMLEGRIDEALTVARPLFGVESVDPVARTFAAFTLVAGGNFVGNFTETEEIFHAALPLAEVTRAAVPYGIATVMVSSVIALTAAGHLEKAEKRAQMMYDEGLGADDEWMRPRGASGLGVVALMRGQARSATRYFRITVASLNEFDRLFLRYNLSYLARAAALAGFVDEARLVLHAPLDAPQFPVFLADWQMAEAAVLAAEGRLDSATDGALRAARTAASMGEWTITSLAAHDAARYSGALAAAELAATAAERLDAPLPHCFSLHAHARARDDPRLLLEVSNDFEHLGAILHAAEASYAAASGFRSGGDGRAAAEAIVRATSLHARCENASVPWVAGFQSDEVLTRREQQVALLAAAGNPDGAISIALEISVRTVQNHLARAYRKLGVIRRHDLPEALGLTTVDRTGPGHARAPMPE
jgi:DNA-binding CsgD family transcriptional regulator